MRIIVLAIGLLVTCVTLPAHADLLRATRAGVMCSSAGALAKLSLPGGGSRDDGDHPPAAAETIARAGGCINFREGTIVIVEHKRPKTSIVRSDSLTGDGFMVEVIVANIDFVPYAPPHDGFYDTIRARCPTLLDDITAGFLPTREFVDSLPAATRGVINRTVEANCSDLGRCQEANRAAEIGRRRLEPQWASFLCDHPKIAVEPNTIASDPVRE